ncbi:MAG: N-acyl-D-amino-acid deacylase family protein [Armatimonadota bacterium]
MFDILLVGGSVLDGSGRPAFRADVGVVGDRIVEVGELSGAEAARRICVQGLAVAPGFIDIHSHSDFCLLANPLAFSKITQGVTTEVSGNCGFSAGPIIGDSAGRDFDRYLSELEIANRWRTKVPAKAGPTLGEFLDLLEETGIAVNFCTLVGHGNIRNAVLGASSKPASTEDLERMQELAREALEQGAVGISTGLIYPPGCYANTDELSNLVGAVSAHGKILYATHMRNESDRLESALAEAIEIGRRSGARVQISHHKACGRANWGKVAQTLQMIDEAVESGVDVWADQYPYTATSTSLSALLPNWVHEGGRDAALARLSDPISVQKIRGELVGKHASEYKGSYYQAVMIAGVKSEKNAWTVGKRLAEVAHEWGVDPVDALIRLLHEEELSVSMCNFAMCEEDIETVMRHPRVSIGSDASARMPDGPLGRGRPHPRAYGTFARVLGRYVRERRVISLEEAVRKMTSLPASILKLKDRGLLKPGFYADITVFNPNTVADAATYKNPHQTAVGIQHVLVNGKLVVESGRVTGATPGRVLRLRAGGSVE